MGTWSVRLRARLRRAGRRRARLRFLELLAVFDDEAGAAVRLRFPLLAECLDEAAQRALRLRRAELRLDRRFGLGERALAARRRALDPVDVVAERRLQWAAEHVQVRREDRGVERFLLLAFDDFGEQPAVRLALRVDRDPLRHARE